MKLSDGVKDELMLIIACYGERQVLAFVAKNVGHAIQPLIEDQMARAMATPLVGRLPQYWLNKAHRAFRVLIDYEEPRGSEEEWQ